MKNHFKISLLLLIICLSLCGCSKGKKNTSSKNVTSSPNNLNIDTVLVGNIPCTFPLVSDSSELNILATGYGDILMEDVYVWKKYQKMTGVNINWTTVTKSERAEAVNSTLTNKQAIDLIIRCKLSSSKLTQYGENGLILDLNKDDLLKNNAPNCWAYLQSHPEALASVTNPDGSIYSIPQVNSGAELRVSRKIFINKTWLENVNMELPTTTEELYQLLKVFKEQDANGNGDTTDEIPLCSQDWLSIKECFLGFFGLANRGLHNVTVDCDPITGNARLIAASYSYKDYLTYFNKLYSEGLLDNNVFTIDMAQWINNVENDKIGVFVNTNLTTLPADKMDNWIAIEEALEGPNGDKMYSAVRANFHSTGAAVIPSTCSCPELVLKWLDYFWTDEGTLFYHMGIEGETFVTNDNGTYDYMPSIYDEITNNQESFDDAVARYSPYPGGGNPTVEIAPYFMGGEMAEIPASAARKLINYGPKEYWPSFTFTSEENNTLESIQVDLDKYISTSRVEFINGTRPLTEWDTYVEQLNTLKSADLLNIYQAAIDRYAILKESHKNTDY